MSGHFYAYASKAGCKASRPDWFDADGELIGSRVLVSDQGVWLTEPVLSEADEDGNQTIITPGVRSEPFVVLSSEDDGSPAKKITPTGYGGFA